MQMIDVLKRLTELDQQNPNRPEYKVSPDQNISTSLNESTQVEECGMMGDMGRYEKPSTPASINMSAGSGEELGDLIRAIASIAGGHDHDKLEPLASVPTTGIASTGGMDMKSMMDKLNDIDSEEKTEETYLNSPADPNPPEAFDAEAYAHHENPPGADRRGNANNPRAYDTNENFVHQLYQDYQKYLAEQDIRELTQQTSDDSK